MAKVMTASAAIIEHILCYQGKGTRLDDLPIPSTMLRVLNYAGSAIRWSF